MSIIDDLKTYDILYELGNPSISDIEYDKLKIEAKRQFPDDLYFEEVGAKTLKNKVKLPIILGSLNKTKPDGSYNKWEKDHKGKKIVSKKLDGISVYLEYVKGILVSAYTRGDGEYGTDITEKAKLFCKSTLDHPHTLSVRGEAILCGDNHIKLGFKTRRNGAAGLLNRDDNSDCNKLDFIAYELVDLKMGSHDLDLQSEQLWYLESLGLNIVEFFLCDTTNEEELSQVLIDWKQSSFYDIDGIVVGLDAGIREDSKFPDNKCAYKVSDDAIECSVVDVEWSVGRTGRVVPTVIIEPVIVDGVTVERATGFNFEFIRDNTIGNGSKVFLVRSGQVIPYITGIISDGITNIPSECPSCGEHLNRKGVDIVCENVECDAKIALKLEYFLRTLGAENISYKTIEKLGVRTIEGCYSLDEFDISNIDGLGLKKADQIVMEINSTLKTTPDKLLAAFGMNGIGLETARSILKSYDFDKIWSLKESDLTKVSGVGKILAGNFVREVKSFESLYNSLKELGLSWTVSDNTLMGKIFTLTGNGVISRDVLVKMIEKKGGYSKGISKKTDYLVTDNIAEMTTKTQKAIQYGVPIISYEQLIKMIG